MSGRCDFIRNLLKKSFQRFLDERSASTRRIPLEEIEAEIEQELKKQGKTA
jgi:hypothetical protein